MQLRRKVERSHMKDHRANVNPSRISFDDYLGKLDIPDRGSPDELVSSTKCSQHVEQYTDEPVNEQDEPEIEPLELFHLHGGPKSDNPAANNRPLLIPLDEDVPVTGDTPAAPPSNPVPLDDLSPFANLLMLKLRKPEMSNEGEQKASKKAAQGGLIDFLLESGLF